MWLVAHSELRTSRRIRSVFDFWLLTARLGLHHTERVAFLLSLRRAQALPPGPGGDAGMARSLSRSGATARSMRRVILQIDDLRAIVTNPCTDHPLRFRHHDAHTEHD